MPELTTQERCWWQRPDDARDDEDPKAHEKLGAVIRHLEREQDRKRSLLLYGAMYGGGVPPAGGGMAVDSYIRTSSGNNRGNLSLNVSRSVVDAVVSRVFSKSEPKLSYVTEGGGPEKQRNAQQLERGVDGCFYNTRAYPKFVLAGRDGCVYGTGITKIYPNFDEHQVEVERWRPWEMLFDDAECIYSSGDVTGTEGARNLYTRKYVDKWRLMHLVRTGVLCPDASAEDIADRLFYLDKLTGTKDDDAEFGYSAIAYRIRLEEAWHRPSGRDAEDGRHVIGAANVTILDEPWDGGPRGRPWPFTWYKWSEPIEGFYGQGLVELGAGIQAEINKLVKEIQAGHHLIKGKWLIAQGSEVIAAHINNDLSALLRYKGIKPEYVPPAIISPEVYSHLWNLVQKYYELSGINQQAAQAQKPAGLDSGEAQRVYADQQTETLLDKGKRFESYVRDSGQLVTDSARALARKGSYEVRAMADDAFQTIDWKRLEDPDGYELRVSPTSSLPGTPSGKIELAEDLLKVGDIDAADLMEIIGMPDILQTTTEKQASRRLVRKRVGEMLLDGKPYEPHAFLNLPEAVVIATNMLNNAEDKETDDAKLQLVRDFIVKAQKLVSAAQPPAPQNVAPGQPAMMGPGQAAAVMPGPAAPQPNGAPPPAQAA